jgi:hypothetical protein
MHNLLPWYLPRRARIEAVLWATFFTFQATLNALTALMDARRAHAQSEAWEPFVQELSSNFVILALLPLLLAFEHRRPLQFSTLRTSLAWHVPATAVFSLLHVGGMVALRKAVYRAFGYEYVFGPWASQWFYEYLKDVRTYALLLGVVLTYRWVLLRLQGEARLLVAPDTGLPIGSIERPERFLVRKLGAEFLVAAVDIEWLESSENYVNLHVRGNTYPLRSTMAAIEKRLDPTCFVRVHRRFIVNIAFLRKIQPLDSGDARLELHDGTTVPCSRTYRANLRSPGLTSSDVARRATGS